MTATDRERDGARRRHRIAAIPGDGIGIEATAAARTVLDTAAAGHGCDLVWCEYDWSCARYLRSGQMMPADGLDQLASFDAIFLGAVGSPGVADHTSLWGLLIPIRRAFDQYVNLRPSRLLPGVSSPLAGRGAADIDMVVVRENTEGEYSQVGGRHGAGTAAEAAVQESIFTRTGVQRIVEFAFAEAARRGGSVTSATKSNGIVHTMPFWDEIFAEVAARHPDVPSDRCHVDALAARLVLDPARVDVIVGSNLFGDILSDLAAAVAGSLGLAASGNINPERVHPSMFESVHGSAPDIAGRGTANPIAAVLAGAMMLRHLGEGPAADRVSAAVDHVLGATDVRTPDLGGRSSTEEVTAAICLYLDTDRPAA